MCKVTVLTQLCQAPELVRVEDDALNESCGLGLSVSLRTVARYDQYYRVDITSPYVDIN